MSRVRLLERKGKGAAPASARDALRNPEPFACLALALKGIP